MRTAELFWIQKQLEPDQVIITGNAKRHRPLRAEIIKCKIKENSRFELNEEENNRRQDEYLKSKGV